MSVKPVKLAAIAAALRAWFVHAASPQRRRLLWSAQGRIDPMRARAALQFRTRGAGARMVP